MMESKKNNATHLAKIFKVLSDTNRLKVLLYIYKEQCRCEAGGKPHENEACMKTLAQTLHISVPTVSYHVKELIQGGLVIATKQGKFLHCVVNRDTFRLLNVFLSKFNSIK